MKIAIIGCGFVADFYMESLPLYPNLELVAVTDHDSFRLLDFAAHHRLTCVKETLDEILNDPDIELVLNLTNPDSHYPITKACLQAGKHVYSEKPIAMGIEQAKELFELAKSRQLSLASAPCNVLGETAQSVWKALREQQIGSVKLVYAEMDDGMVFRMPYHLWRSASGKSWPYHDEFEVGCTLEHAAYYTTWLTAFFGPAVSVTAFASCLYPDKQTPEPLERNAPDLSVACIQFASGVVARLTCSIIAVRNQDLRIFGDNGILCVDDSWDYHAPIRIKRMVNVRRRMVISPIGKLYPLMKSPTHGKSPRNANKMEFCRGPSEMASAITAGRVSALPADFCLHNNEIVLAIQHALQNNATYHMTTTFADIQPMQWAR
jgi:predicted dehydrogenase